MMPSCHVNVFAVTFSIRDIKGSFKEIDQGKNIVLWIVEMNNFFFFFLFEK